MLTSRKKHTEVEVERPLLIYTFRAKLYSFSFLEIEVFLMIHLIIKLVYHVSHYYIFPDLY